MSDSFHSDKQVHKMIEKELEKRRAECYDEIKGLITLIIQYQLESWGTENDLDNRNKVMELMDECLGWSGLGHCDGGDIGSGTANIFCFVVEPYLSCDVIVLNLKEKNLIAGAIIAIDREDGFEVMWPEIYAEEFSY